MSSIKSNVNNQVCDIVIQLTCSKDGEFNYELNYNTLQAGWVPYYDIRIKEINSPIKLTYKAKIYQNTNEEWSDIQLSLSTGKLNKSNKAPNFNTQFIRNTTNYRKDTKQKNRNISSMSIRMNEMKMKLMKNLFPVLTIRVLILVEHRLNIIFPYPIQSHLKNLHIY